MNSCQLGPGRAGRVNWINTNKPQGRHHRRNLPKYRWDKHIRSVAVRGKGQKGKKSPSKKKGWAKSNLRDKHGRERRATPSGKTNKENKPRRRLSGKKKTQKGAQKRSAATRACGEESTSGRLGRQSNVHIQVPLGEDDPSLDFAGLL